MRIVYLPEALSDLREINSYISDVLLNPIVGENTVEKIIKSCHRLTEYPNLGVSLQAKTGRETDYRCLFCGNYIAFYLAESETVKIVRILDGRTDYMRAIFNE